MSYAVETESLTKQFREIAAVSSVSMKVPRGVVYGFLGANGAGKTTTLKMILGLLTPTSGRVKVGGVDIMKDRLFAARSVGALLEANTFYPKLTGRKNLEITARLLGLHAREIDRVLEIVDMNVAAKRSVGGYSLGMRQRLGIARALLGEPLLIILDEPTNGLDPDGILEMRTFLKALPERANATVLLSSHLLSEVEQTVTHIGIIHEGRLVMEGAMHDVMIALPRNLSVVTNDPEKSAEIAGAFGLDPVAGSQEVFTPRDFVIDRDRIENLNAALVRAGVRVSELTLRPSSLETIYRRQTRREPRKAAQS